MANQNVWLIDNFNGGLADQDDAGIAGSFAFGESLNYRENPTYLTGQDAPSLNSTTIIEGLVKWILQSGSDIFAYDDGGKVYKKGTPWTKVRTNTQTGVGNGFAVMGSNLYYASNAKLGKSDTAFAAPDDSAQTFQDGSAGTWHPMKLFGGAGGLCIGDGRYIAVLDYDGTTFYDGTSGSGNDLTLPLDVKVKCLEVWNDYLVIGTFKGTNSYDDNVAEIFFWDGTSTSYNFSINLNESGVHQLLASPSGLMIQAGIRGNVYVYNGGAPVLVKRLPTFAQSGTAYNEMFPGAVTNFKGVALLGGPGFKADTGSYVGTWSYGVNNKNYAHSLNLDYLLSTGNKTGANRYIGAIHAANDTALYISYRDGANYGIDLANTNNKVAMCLFRSLWFDGGQPFSEKNFKTFYLNFEQMAANETITLKYRTDTDSSFTTMGAVTSTGENFLETNAGIKCRRIQIQVELSGTNNTLCELRSIAAPFSVLEAN